MTDRRSNDELDAFERRLASRVRQHADGGVRPFDAADIARSAATGRQRAGVAGTWLPRLGWLGGALAVAIVAFAGGIFAANAGLFGSPSAGASPSLLAVAPTASPSPAPTVAPTTLVPVESAVPSAAPITACTSDELSARVTAWSGAAGSRIASVTLTNTGAVACRLATMDRPELVDGAGHVLIEGSAATGTATVVLHAGASVRTQAEAANYCGADSVAPVSVAFVLADNQRVVASPRSASDTFGLPPCNGSGVPATMTMHPWAP